MKKTINMKIKMKDEITQREILRAITKIKNEKALGEDGLPVEILKSLEEVGVEWMARIFNAALNQDKILNDWGKVIDSLSNI